MSVMYCPVCDREFEVHNANRAHLTPAHVSQTYSPEDCKGSGQRLARGGDLKKRLGFRPRTVRP